MHLLKHNLRKQRNSVILWNEWYGINTLIRILTVNKFVWIGYLIFNC